MKKKGRPVKLSWREDVLQWVNDNRRALPKGVSRPAAHAVIGMLMQAANVAGRDVMASARWLELETGVNHAACADLLGWLVEHRWLEFVGEGARSVPIYDLISEPRRITPQSEPANNAEDDSAVGAGDRGSDRGSSAEDNSHTTHHRTHLLSDKGLEVGSCPVCGWKVGHDPDSDCRPFDDSIDTSGIGFDLPDEDEERLEVRKAKTLSELAALQARWSAEDEGEG